MLNEQVAFKNVICLGHILDEKGEKMSKSKGNIVNPWDVLDKHGADAFRWYMYTATAPGEPRRFSSDLVGEVVTKFWLTLWNTYSFFVTYANIDGWTPGSAQPPVSERDELDRWILSELHQLTRQVTEAFESYDATGATRPIQAFVDVLSNWYVRLSRRRFWKSESDDDKAAAYATLYECLVTVAKLIAPTMPYLSDSMYRNLVTTLDEKAAPSVHLAMFPEANTSLINRALMDEMELVQRLVSLGRKAREDARIGVRQPLAEVKFVTRQPKEADAVAKYRDLIASELNVKAVDVLSDAGAVVNYALNPLPASLGRKFGKDFPRFQKYMREGDAAMVRGYAEALVRGETINVELDGQRFEAAPGEIEVKRSAAAGFAIAEDMGYLAALDTRLDDTLLAEGLAREVVRRIQTMRKDADFNIEDTIVLRYQAGDKLRQAIEKHADYIRGETLTEVLEVGEPENGFFQQEFDLDGEKLALGVRRTNGK
ncbi:MAG: class I tRNA ligase family protein [Rhodospirillales bacterium]|nr:class I tRNA ligase family protein [Rhodospirillales bacterium]